MTTPWWLWAAVGVMLVYAVWPAVKGWLPPKWKK